MRIFINGAAGFVGRSLMHRYWNHPDYQMMGVDPLPSDLPNCYAITDYEEMCFRIKTFAPHCIIHLAAYSGTDAGMAACASNIRATADVLSIAKELDINVVLAGSAEEYGRSTYLGLHRENDPLRPTNLYGVSKAAQSMMAQHADVNAIVLRFANIYGPGQTGKFIPNIIRKLSQREQVTLTTERKSWLHIEDCLDAIMQAVSKLHTGFTGFDAFNIIGRDIASAEGIGHVIADLLAIDLDDLMVINEIDGDCPPLMTGDAAMLRLDWVPHIRLRDGLQTIIQSIRKTA